MLIHEYYYNEHNKTLNVEFSILEDKNDFYRVIELDIQEIKFFSPTIITEEDIMNFNEDNVIEILLYYFEDNDLPEQIKL